jgi:hypothetical protein
MVDLLEFVVGRFDAYRVDAMYANGQDIYNQ